jgi:hypothetical protein
MSLAHDAGGRHAGSRPVWPKRRSVAGDRPRQAHSHRCGSRQPGRHSRGGPQGIGVWASPGSSWLPSFDRPETTAPTLPPPVTSKKGGGTCPDQHGSPTLVGTRRGSRFETVFDHDPGRLNPVSPAGAARSATGGIPALVVLSIRSRAPSGPALRHRAVRRARQHRGGGGQAVTAFRGNIPVPQDAELVSR